MLIEDVIRGLLEDEDFIAAFVAHRAPRPSLAAQEVDELRAWREHGKLFRFVAGRFFQDGNCYIFQRDDAALPPSPPPASGDTPRTEYDICNYPARPCRPTEEKEKVCAYVQDLERELAGANDQREVSRKMIDGLCELRDELKAQLKAAQDEVWCVSNKTSSLLFKSKEMAHAYIAQFGASIGGGMSITNMPVLRFPSASTDDRGAG